MTLYRRIDNPQDGDLVQYVGVYVTNWQPNVYDGDKVIGFIEDDSCDDLLAACEAARDATSCDGCEGQSELSSDCTLVDNPTERCIRYLANQQLRAAIAKARGKDSR